MTDATRSRRATDTPTPSDSPAGQRSAREALPAVAALSDSCADPYHYGCPNCTPGCNGDPNGCPKCKSRNDAIANILADPDAFYASFFERVRHLDPATPGGDAAGDLHRVPE
jgi:hypothetical protein